MSLVKTRLKPQGESDLLLIIPFIFKLLLELDNPHLHSTGCPKKTQKLLKMIYRASQKKLMPFQIQISREFHYGSLNSHGSVVSCF